MSKIQLSKIEKLSGCKALAVFAQRTYKEKSEQVKITLKDALCLKRDNFKYRVQNDASVGSVKTYQSNVEIQILVNE